MTGTIPIGSSPAALAVVDGACGPPRSPPPPRTAGGPCTSASSAARTIRSRSETRVRRRAFLPASLVYDGLVGYRRAGGAAGGTLVANLALDVPEPSADERTYLFRLRPDLRFSNGAPVRPDDVRASWSALDAAG